ncbi:protein hedgehog [Favolaschia claudopus]|uniref:Protein hedgehog n=1 Tax=Favolaschia claudopus TaxID=2862362 RepID=A0AAW0AW85_9AGAR
MDTWAKKRIAKLKMKPEDIIAIIFAHCDERGKSTGFPFDRNTQFLGWRDGQLFSKLWVVLSSSRTILVRNWTELCGAGMHVEEFQRTSTWVAEFLLKLGNASSASPESLSRQAPQLRLEQAPQPVTGRHQTQANIVLFGNTGHGKSKTINRLLGQNLLLVGKKTLGSTTKVIRRVQLHPRGSITSTPHTLAIDDTPGFEDTTYEDREINAALIRRYAEHQVLSNKVRIYPNIILVVVAWDSITPDAMNSPEHFTSAAGKSMYALSNSGLVDPERPNVIVVVTKSLSQLADLRKSKHSNDLQWRMDAQKRMTVLADIQRKVFPRLHPWQIVFIENGGGNSIPYSYPTLPNGELSHQNLLDAIRKLVEFSGPRGTRDTAGIKALDYLIGAVPWEVREEILLSRMDVVPKPVPVIVDTKRRVQELTDLYLGVTYNPITETFGRSTVLNKELAQPANVIERGTEFIKEDETLPQRLGAHRENTTAPRDIYTAEYLAAVKTITQPVLSQEMISIISRLPRWSEAAESEYSQFFRNHGTHVVCTVALGGTLRVTLPPSLPTTRNGQTRGKVRTKASKSKKKNQELAAPAPSTLSSVSIIREGGTSASGDFIISLQNHFKPSMTSAASSANALRWPSDGLRTQWTKSLDQDPTFCANSAATKYERLDKLGGLSAAQQVDLREAINVYLSPVKAVKGQKKPKATKKR